MRRNEQEQAQTGGTDVAQALVDGSTVVAFYHELYSYGMVLVL
jgi:hypothetical protein